MKNETNDILQRLNAIFQDVLDNPEIQINALSKADDIEEWDSLTNIQLVVAIEKKFSVKFTTQEIQSWNQVGDIIAALEMKLKGHE